MMVLQCGPCLLAAAAADDDEACVDVVVRRSTTVVDCALLRHRNRSDVTLADAAEMSPAAVPGDEDDDVCDQ